MPHWDTYKIMGVSGKDVHTNKHTHTYACTRAEIWAAEYHLRNHILCLSVERRNLTPPSPYTKTPESSLIWAGISTFNMHKGTAKVVAGAQDGGKLHKFLEINGNGAAWTNTTSTTPLRCKFISLRSLNSSFIFEGLQWRSCGGN